MKTNFWSFFEWPLNTGLTVYCFFFVFQTFDIKLIGVTGGALIGPKNTTRIAILKNDSPNGLFRFATTAVRAF